MIAYAVAPGLTTRTARHGARLASRTHPGVPHQVIHEVPALHARGAFRRSGVPGWGVEQDPRDVRVGTEKQGDELAEAGLPDPPTVLQARGPQERGGVSLPAEDRHRIFVPDGAHAHAEAFPRHYQPVHGTNLSSLVGDAGPRSGLSPPAPAETLPLAAVEEGRGVRLPSFVVPEKYGSSLPQLHVQGQG